MNSKLLVLVVSAAAVAAMAVFPAAAVAAAPSNDDFDASTVVAALPFSDATDTREATRASDDPGACFVNNSVWYRFAPDRDMNARISVAGSSYDAIIGLYTGTRGSLQNVDCGRQLVPNLQAGVTYYLMVNGCCYIGGPDGGDLKLSIEEVFPPANDDWDTATPVTSLPFQATETTLLATTAADDDFFYNKKSVWFSFTPTTARRVAISTTGSDYQTDVAVHSGTRDARGYAACDYPASGVQWCNLEAGTTYHIVVSAAYAVGGTLVFAVLDLPTMTLSIDARAVIGLPDNPAAFRITGRATCSEAMTIYYEAWFIQDNANTFAQGQIACSPSGTQWAVDFPDSGYFLPGDGTATMNASGVGVAGPVYASAASSVALIRFVKGQAELAGLISQVDSLHLSQLGTSLRDKLATAQRMLVSGKVRQACENLDSFLGEVKAQTGKGLTMNQGRSLTTGAQEAKRVIGC
jgi:hypothetical protein